MDRNTVNIISPLSGSIICSRRGNCIFVKSSSTNRAAAAASLSCTDDGAKAYAGVHCDYYSDATSYYYYCYCYYYYYCYCHSWYYY